jgi:hypothetical protein
VLEVSSQYSTENEFNLSCSCFFNSAALKSSEERKRGREIEREREKKDRREIEICPANVLQMSCKCPVNVL